MYLIEGLKESFDARLAAARQHIIDLFFLDNDETLRHQRMGKLDGIGTRTLGSIRGESPARKNFEELDKYRFELNELLAKEQSKADQKRAAVLRTIEALKREAEILIDSDDYKHYRGIFYSAKKEFEEAYQITIKYDNNGHDNLLNDFLEKQKSFLKNKLNDSINKRKQEAERHHATLQHIECKPASPEKIAQELAEKCRQVICRKELEILDNYNKALKKHIGNTYGTAPDMRAKAAKEGYRMIQNAMATETSVRGVLNKAF